MGELLGRGGMSSVYEATHRNGKRVAIKVLRNDLFDHRRTRRRFLREGHIANQVGHPGVVAVLDDAIEDGIAFFVMDLLEGTNVEQYCAERGGALHLGEVLAIADAVLDILIAAHAKPIVHRDIKPSNLFLTSAGALKLLDFGIASFREATGVTNATGDGVVLGTPGFMAPEQARARWKEIDVRTDLWAVGALMFRLLTGRLVYETESSNEYVIAAATQDAPSLGSIDPTLPRGIVAVVDRALRRDAARRWQTAAEMWAAVRSERSQFADSRLPRPALRQRVATLDESESTAGLANELRGAAGDGASFISEDRTAVRWGLWFASGALVAVALLFLVSRRAEPSSPGLRAIQPPATISAPASDMPTGGAISSQPAAVAVQAESPPTAAIATPVSRVAPAHPVPERRSGTRRALPERPHEPPPPIPAAPPARVRLEDVLDERR